LTEHNPCASKCIKIAIRLVFNQVNTYTLASLLSFNLSVYKATTSLMDTIESLLPLYPKDTPTAFQVRRLVLIPVMAVGYICTECILMSSNVRARQQSGYTTKAFVYRSPSSWNLDERLTMFTTMGISESRNRCYSYCVQLACMSVQMSLQPQILSYSCRCIC